MIGTGIIIFLLSCVFVHFHNKTVQNIRNKLIIAGKWYGISYENAASWLDFVLVNKFSITVTPVILQIWGIVGLLLIILGMFIPIEVTVKYHEMVFTFR